MPNTSINRNSREILLEISSKRWYNVYHAIKDGFDVNTDIEKGKTILCYAVESAELIRVTTVLQFKPNAKNESNINSLIYAFRSNVQDNLILDSLLRYGFDLNCNYLTSHEAFYFAVRIDNYDFCEHFSKSVPNMQDIKIKYPYMLHTALEEGFSKTALLLLNLGWNINTTDQSGKTPLHYAFQYHQLTASEVFEENDDDDQNDLFSAITPIHKEVVKILVEHPDIDWRAADCEGSRSANYVINDRSIFSDYAQEKKINFLKFLMRKGVDINLQHAIGIPLIHEAAENGYEKIVQFLLDHGANPNAVDKYGETALHVALDFHKFKVANIFLNYKIDLSSKNKCGEPLLISACRVRHKDILDRIFKFNNNMNLIQTYENALNVAISYAHENDESAEVVRILLENKANVNCIDENGRTPMHNVFFNSFFNAYRKFQKNDSSENLLSFLTVTQVKIIRMLLSHPDIDLTIADYNGRTIMNYLVKRNKIFSVCSEEQTIGLIELFLQTGMNINAQNDNVPIIHEAVKSGSERIVKILLDHGADINAKDKFGQTAIHIALDQNKRRMVDMFLNCKVDVSSRNKNKESLLYSACRVHHEKAVQKILEFKAVVNQVQNGKTALHAICSKIYQDDTTVKIVTSLLNYKADVNIVDEYGRTPLHYACKRSNEQVVKLLLKHRAKVNIVDEKGSIPLHNAIIKKQLNIIQLLLKYGANVNKCCNRARSSPLFLAVNLNDDGCYEDFLPYDPFNKPDSDFASPGEIIDSLLEYGANINYQDKWGRTALHIVCKLGKDSLISHLLDYNPDFNIVDKNGFTPLRLVAHELELCHQNDSLEYIEYSSMFSELLSHMIKMQAANVYVSAENLQLMKSEDIWKFDPDNDLEDWNALFDECKKELLKLKKMFPGTIISYYDILIKDVKEIAKYVNDADVSDEWSADPSNCENYFNIIETKTNQLYARKGLLDKTYTVFNFLSRNSPYLPRLCIEKICSDLTDGDLRNVLIVLNEVSAYIDLEMNDDIENLFYDTLNNKIKGIAISDLPKKCFKIFNSVFVNRPNLPSNCLKKICCDLSDTDLRNLLSLHHTVSNYSVASKDQIDTKKFYSENSKRIRLM